MCGIAAAFNFADDQDVRSVVAKLAAALSHRGDQPPTTRSVQNGELGCARLAIVGGKSGSQPLVSRDGRFTVVYNGEIYNWRELRETLSQRGCVFETDCDTEVLMHGFAVWNAELPARLEGMFAFVIHDGATRQVFAARDALGIKPLYYVRQLGAGIAFASEIRPLVGLSDEVLELPPGTLHDGGAVRRWAPTVVPHEDSPATPAAAVARFHYLFRAGVRARCQTELPIAVYCSGGIDSSALLLEAARAAPGRVTAFCVGTAGAEDVDFARDVAARVDVPFRVVAVREREMLDSIPETIRTIESFEPNHIRAGTVNLALAREVARSGFKVALCGEGADELLGGYEEFRLTPTPMELQSLFDVFLGQLHRTQLQRVDRVNMRFGIEARVPFLDDRLVAYVRSLPNDLKVRPREAGAGTDGKWVLRSAYSVELPTVAWRRKVPMGEGAGIGDNSARGIFHEHALRMMPQEEFRKYQAIYQKWGLRNQEEAYYFSIYKDIFGPLRLSRDRPRTNLAPTTA